MLLFLSYIIGLWFTLRTHAALIWAENEEKKAPHPAQDPFAFEPRHLLFPGGGPEASGAINSHKDSIRESPLYKRILGQSLRHVGLEDSSSSIREQSGTAPADQRGNIPHLVPPRTGGDEGRSHRGFPSLSNEENERLVRQVTELAATAATVAARDAARNRKVFSQQSAKQQAHRAEHARAAGEDLEDPTGLAVEPTQASRGHDAPNWSKIKSSVILLGATVLYAIIAEILVNTVDVVLESVDIDEKFLGITLFALVPNTTEFLVSWIHICHFELEHQANSNRMQFHSR